MNAPYISASPFGSQTVPRQQPTNELDTERFLLSAARIARNLLLAAAWLVVIPVFSPVIVLVWLSIKLHDSTGRALSDRSLTSLPHAKSGVEASAEAQTLPTPEQQAWIAEMEYFDRF